LKTEEPTPPPPPQKKPLKIHMEDPTKILKYMEKVIFCLAYQGKDIVFRFIIEYSSLRDFGPY